MKIIPFSEIKNELISNMQRGLLIPIIGSGFTRNCSSFRGKVPSGNDYRRYMIGRILEAEPSLSVEKERLEKETFSNISSMYHKVVPNEAQEQYLWNNFTRVAIEDKKKDLLSLPWPYIYTLNIDDGIEKNSDYCRVINANRPVNDHIFDSEKCVIKLHGDVYDMLSYTDSHSEVFTQEQYITSLKKNDTLLSKLKHDSIFQNLLFLGCSLDDEIDLLYSFVPTETQGNQTARYICVTQKPSFFDELKYEKYGITHCIVFDSYDSIYDELYSVGIEAQKINVDDLAHYRKFGVRKLLSDYESNKSFLLFGKSLIGKDHTITLPYYFITRKESTTIINNFTTHSLQLLIGSRCSGKSYILADIASKIRDRDVFYFETKDRLSDQAFDQLLCRENCVILADNAALSNDQFEMLLDKLSTLEERKIIVVIAVNKSNRDFSSILKLYELQGRISSEKIPQISIANTFSSEELAQLNPLLTAIDVGIFSRHKTIVDNIIDVSNKLAEKNRYDKATPKCRNVRELASLIVLGIERKVYSSLATKLDLHQELLNQQKATEPLIDCEATWSFEKSGGDNSPVKYVLNAEYWLCGHLEAFARNEDSYGQIVNAYKYIISQIIAHEGKPDLLYGNRVTSYKDYIFFDNINRLFSFNRASGKKGLALIRGIYEGLNNLLSVDPNYMHQRAKCYIKSSYYETDTNGKLDYLDKAYRDANVALQVFTQRYDECGNEKLVISMDHIVYTQALILCHKCFINDYSDISANTFAIHTLHTALNSPYNTYSFAKTDSFNYQSVVEKIVYATIANKGLVHPEAYGWLQDLFRLISETE